MEYIYLVKELDYVLIHEVISEIDKKSNDGDEFEGKPK